MLSRNRTKYLLNPRILNPKHTMQFPFNIKPLRRPRLRRSVRALPLLLLNGALVQVAHAQSTGAQTAEPSGIYSLVSTLSVFAFFALLVGLFRPKTFAFLFKEKATRGRVCGVFGAAWLFLVILSGPLRPKPVATAPTTTVAQSAPGRRESAVRAAEQRAKAAEARAVRAEKAAASANAKASAKPKDESKDESVAAESTSQTAPKDDSLPSNVEEVDVEGLGKRQIGEVDEVLYTVVQLEKAQTVGGEYFNKSADGVFYVLRMRAFNRAKKTHNIRTRQMKLLDDQDREFDPSSEAGVALNASEKKSVWSSQLQPGVTRDFNLVYDAPADVKGLKLKIPAGGFGFGKSASIKVPDANE